MPNKLAHFAIHADDVERARTFYERVFAWRFEAWGPPNFYLIHGAGVHGALQERSEPKPNGASPFECTFAVDDLDASIRLIEEAGGQIKGAKFEIPTIGELVQFADTEGNHAIVMQYAPERAAQMGLAS